jgi:hypothetical protein
LQQAWLAQHSLKQKLALAQLALALAALQLVLQ